MNLLLSVPMMVERGRDCLLGNINIKGLKEMVLYLTQIDIWLLFDQSFNVLAIVSRA
jgi:hypothetical protein